MKLWYINIRLNPTKGYSNDYRYEFTLHTRFISNYLSKHMRMKKNRFETDGTFNMISVEPTPHKTNGCKIVPEDALAVSIPFERDRYEKIKQTEDCEYYLELLQEGFKLASEYKEVPLATLLNLISEFRENGCKNEWLHKKKIFRKQDIQVMLNCYFTTLDFSLVITINRFSTKEELCSGILLKTEPDEIVFSHKFKDILIDNGKIVITDFIDKPSIKVNLKKALKNQLKFKVID